LFVGIPEGERPLARPKSRWKNNVKTGLKGREWDEMKVYQIKRSHNKDNWWAVVSTAMNLRLTQNGKDFVTSCEIN